MYKLPNGKIVYPEDIECVHEPINGKGGIWVGNLQAAQNLQTLKKHGIKAILTAAKGIFLNHSKTQIPYQLYIPGEDHQKFDMSKYFNQSITFIRDALQKTNILVHCLAGVSRSVSLVMAYFIKYHNMGYDSVYTKIKAKRKIIHPNDGFIAQLRKFESQCRQNGPVMQKSQIYQMRSSYSPSKRIDRRGYQGIYASPQKLQDNSIENRYQRNLGYSQYDSNYARFHPNHTSQQENMKNPQLYKSIVEDLRAERGYKNNTGQMRHISPDRYQKENRSSTSFGMKRLSSMNVDLQLRNQNGQRGQIYSNYQRYDVRNRIRSDYKPLDSIQNKQYDMDSEIDRKIAEIRKKYQEYTKKTETVQERHDRIRLEKKYSNVSAIHQGSENSNMDDFMDLKIRKGATNYQQSISDLYGGVGMVRNNNYFNQAPVTSSSSSKFVGSRLRRLQSYQV